MTSGTLTRPPAKPRIDRLDDDDERVLPPPKFDDAVLIERPDDKGVAIDVAAVTRTLGVFADGAVAVPDEALPELTGCVVNATDCCPCRGGGGGGAAEPLDPPAAVPEDPALPAGAPAGGAMPQLEQKPSWICPSQPFLVHQFPLTRHAPLSRTSCSFVSRSRAGCSRASCSYAACFRTSCSERSHGTGGIRSGVWSGFVAAGVAAGSLGHPNRAQIGVD